MAFLGLSFACSSTFLQELGQGFFLLETIAHMQRIHPVLVISPSQDTQTHYYLILETIILYLEFPVKLNMHVFRLWEETTPQRKPGHTQEENAKAKLK